MSLLLSKEQDDARLSAIVHPKSHPYSEVFLNDMDELHRFVYVVLARGDVKKDFFSLVDAYNCTSELRKYMDKGSQIALDSGHKQCVNSIRQEFCYDRPMDQEINLDTARWMGSVYNHFQWKYGASSADICTRIPAKELHSLYPSLKDETLDTVCDKLYEEYYEMERRPSFEISIKKEAMDLVE